MYVLQSYDINQGDKGVHKKKCANNAIVYAKILECDSNRARAHIYDIRGQLWIFWGFVFIVHSSLKTILVLFWVVSIHHTSLTIILALGY